MFERWKNRNREQRDGEVLRACVEDIRARIESEDFMMQGITADDIQLFLAHSQRIDRDTARKIITIGNTPEILSTLPWHVVYRDPAPASSEPSSELLREKLAPLAEDEERIRIGEFIEAMKDGRIPTFIHGNNKGANVGFSGIDEFPNFRDALSHTGHSPASESPIFTNKLIAGYRKAKGMVRQYDFNCLTSHQGAYIIPDGGFVNSFDHQSSAERGIEIDMLTNLVQKARDSKNQYAYYIRGKTIHFATNDQPAPICAAFVGQKLVRVLDVPTKPTYVFDVFMARNDCDPSGRAGYLALTMLIADAEQGRVGLRDPHSAGDPVHDPYQYFLRAIATNPGFILDAIRGYLPEVLEATGSRSDRKTKFYEKRTGAVAVTIDIPELKTIGVAGEREFTQLEPLNRAVNS